MEKDVYTDRGLQFLHQLFFHFYLTKTEEQYAKYEEYEKAKRYETEKWTPESVGSQYAALGEWRNNSRENESVEPKWKQHPGFRCDWWWK